MTIYILIFFYSFFRGSTSGSVQGSGLRDHFRLGVDRLNGVRGLKPGELYERQAVYLVYFCSGPLFLCHIIHSRAQGLVPVLCLEIASGGAQRTI